MEALTYLKTKTPYSDIVNRGGQVISLGYFCAVANELKRIEMRHASYPFDWLISANLATVIALIDNGFKDFLSPEYLVQEKEVKLKYYYNTKCDVHFYHDFSGEVSLSEQIDEVREKYNRRIAHFYQTIQQPTLFLRFLTSPEECAFASYNYNEILSILHRHNAKNHIVFIANTGIQSDKITIFNVEPAVKNPARQKFLEKNEDLLQLLLRIKQNQRQEQIT